MRRDPPFLPPEVRHQAAGPETTLTLEVDLITRLFGGGARARAVDAISWLRPPALKSALRFWWRAGNAHRFESLAELHARESEIFGSAAYWKRGGGLQGGPGLVTVEVETARLQVEAQPYKAFPSEPLNVAYFPAAEMGREAAWLGASGRARIKVTARKADQAARQEIAEALVLWLVLGGAGARTRRGAGAVSVTSASAANEGLESFAGSPALRLPRSGSELETFLRDRCARRALSGDLDGVFALGRCRQVLLGATALPTAERAHKEVLRALQRARQDRRANHKGVPDRGRSNWPEPDALRWKTGKVKTHPPDAANVHRYPRAALGLPIIIDFPAARGPEPPKHYVLGGIPGAAGTFAKLDRHASPILLRPIRVWEGERAVYVPVAVFTESTLPTSARAFVTEDPKVPVAGAADPDLTPFVIASEADATLARVEQKFLDHGFQRLFP